MDAINTDIMVNAAKESGLIHTTGHPTPEGARFAIIADHADLDRFLTNLHATLEMLPENEAAASRAAADKRAVIHDARGNMKGFTWPFLELV